jgi:hypothetical protein
MKKTFLNKKYFPFFFKYEPIKNLANSVNFLEQMGVWNPIELTVADDTARQAENTRVLVGILKSSKFFSVFELI